LQFFQRSLVLVGEFDKDGGVFEVTRELIGFLNCSFEAAALAKDLLSAFLIAPKIRFAGLFFYPRKLGTFIFGVKETSATPRRARPSLRISVSVLQSFSSPHGLELAVYHCPSDRRPPPGFLRSSKVYHAAYNLATNSRF